MNRLLRALGWLSLILGAGIGLWTLFPLPRKTIESQITFKGHDYNLTLSAPTVVRVGEASEAMLQLSPPPGLSKADTDGLWWQASIVANGITVNPNGETSKPLLNKTTVFRWQLRADVPIHGECAVWLHTLYAPKTGAETRFTLFTTSWKVKTQWMGGLSPFIARLLAIAALLIGFVVVRAAREEE